MRKIHLTFLFCYHIASAALFDQSFHHQATRTLMKVDGLLKLQENSIVDWKDEIKRLESKIENGERHLNEFKDKIRTVLGDAQNSSEKDLLDTKFGVTEKTRARSKHPFRQLGDGVENNPDNGSGQGGFSSLWSIKS